MSQAELARRVGITQPSINHLIKKGAGGSAHLHKIARVLETTVEYLTGETDDPSPAATLSDRRLAYRAPEPEPEPEYDPADIIWLREADLVLGLGGGYLDSHVDERPIPFPAAWVRQYSDAPPAMLKFIEARGTSMEPTITDRSMCMIDVSRTRIDEQDELWACAYGGLGMVKRLRSMPDGTVKVMSDNQAVRDEIASDGELFIIGRCCGVLRRS